MFSLVACKPSGQCGSPVNRQVRPGYATGYIPDIGVDLPSRGKLSKRYLIHALGGLLELGGGGLGPALGGIGALWSFVLVA